MNQMTPIHSTEGDVVATAAVSRADLHKAAKLAAATIAPPWSTVPVLHCALVSIGADGLRIAATDLDRETASRVDAETDGAACILIHARTLAAFARGAEGPVSITVSGEGEARRVTLSDGLTTLRLRCAMDPTDYPHRIERWREANRDAPTFEISPAALLRLLKLTRPCVSNEETRYYLHGVHFGVRPGGRTLRACATNGHLLAVINSDVEIPDLDPSGAIVPARIIDMILQMLGRADGNMPWRVNCADGAIALSCGDVELWAKVIDGKFPAVDRVVSEPSDNLVAHLNVALLRRISGVQRAINPGAHGSKAVELDCAGGMIRHRSPEGDAVEHPLQGQAAPGFDRIGFNLDYLLTIARLAGTVTISAKGNDEPARLVGDDPDALWIVMPMRL